MKNKLIISFLLGTTLLSSNASAGQLIITGGSQLKGETISIEGFDIIKDDISSINANDLKVDGIKYPSYDEYKAALDKKNAIKRAEAAKQAQTDIESALNLKLAEEKKVVEEKLKAKQNEIFSKNPELLKEFELLNSKGISMTEEEFEKALQTPEAQKALNSPEVIAYKNSSEYIENLGLSLKEDREILSNTETSAEEKKIILNDINQANKTTLTSTSGDFKISDLTPVQKPDTLTTEALMLSIDNASSLVDNRMIDVTALSAGDEVTPYGVWIKGIYSQAKQEAYKSHAAYDSKQKGVVVGFDFGDQPIIGFAYSYSDNQVDSKDTKMKENIKSHIGTIYGLFKMNDFFLDGQVRYGRSNIEKSRDNGNLNNSISKGKTTGNLMGGKIEFGYDYILDDNFHVTPSLGLSYDQLKVKGYQESDGLLNRKINDRTADRTAALAGIRITKAIESGSFTMIPELHANLAYALNAKNDATIITFVDGMNPITTPSGKAPKMFYKIGGSVKFTQSKMMDLGLGYDLGASKKLSSHTGYVNVRFNF